MYRTRSNTLAAIYDVQDKFCFCTNIEGLIEELCVEHRNDEWRLFIDSSKTSLKVILMNNGHTLLTVPQSHAVEMKET